VRTIKLDLPTPEWALPLLEPARYKGAKGGRASGKSHFFAEAAVEEMVVDPHLRFVCIREVQRSLKFSAKALIERKIRAMGVSPLFDVLTTEIRRKGGDGVMIFEGMQDHTADSLKSLEGFGRAWVEEAQNLSQRSLDLLLPTIRAAGSEVWFSWNPDQADDPVDAFLVGNPPANATVLHVNYLQNPFVEPEVIAEAERMRALDDDAYAHIWLGGYNVKSDAKVFGGRYVVDEFKPGEDWGGPYHGADFGFAQDPTTLVRLWIHARTLFIERESYAVGLDLHHTAERWERDVPGAARHEIKADNARPESISYLRQHGVPRIVPVEKWKGSVEDGVAYMKQFDRIVVHPRCTHSVEEFRLYAYKVDRRTGAILPQIVDAHNHTIDADRYALGDLIKRKGSTAGWYPGMEVA